MAKVPEKLFYTRTHQWAKYENGIVTVGITDFAQEQLGEIVYAELKWDAGLKGDTVTAVNYDAKGEPACDPINGVSIESQKAVGDIYAPVSGKIVEVNESLKDTPEKINSSPYNEGWLLKIKPSAWDQEKSSLLNAAQYKSLAK
jgi:glycine cleavage system H protein